MIDELLRELSRAAPNLQVEIQRHKGWCALRFERPSQADYGFALNVYHGGGLELVAEPTAQPASTYFWHLELDPTNFSNKREFLDRLRTLIRAVIQETRIIQRRTGPLWDFLCQYLDSSGDWMTIAKIASLGDGGVPSVQGDEHIYQSPALV